MSAKWRILFSGRGVSLLVLTFLPSAILASGTPPSEDANNGLDQCYRSMYDMKFNAAHHCFASWEQAHPQDPIGPVSDAAAYLFDEFDRLKILRFDLFKDKKTFLNRKKSTPNPAIKQKFDNDLQRGQELATKALRHSQQDEGARFANVLRLVLKSDYSALIESQYSQALTEIEKATAEAKNLLAKNPDYYDADLAIGVENYLLSLKPAPTRWFLRLMGAQTSKQTGLAKLRIVAEKGNYLKPYAKVLLAIAALRDNDKQKARQLLSDLAHEFPNNNLFQSELKKLM